MRHCASMATKKALKPAVRAGLISRVRTDRGLQFNARFGGLMSKSTLRKLAGDKYFERGLRYFEGGAVVHLQFGAGGISARVQGTEACPYAVRFWLEKQELQWGCTCPLGSEGAFCKHLVATGLASLPGRNIEGEPIAPGELEALRASLEAIGAQALTDIVSRRAIWDEGLLADLALATRASRHLYPENQPRSKKHAPGRATGRKLAKPSR